MLSFPNAKINLGLNIVEKREDGYHNIETVFYPVGWCDVLEVVSSEKRINRKTDVQFKITGEKIIGSSKKNLCIKAYQLLKEKNDLPPVQMHLHKLIPIGAGLGGGSSDAAAALIGLTKIFNLQISPDELEKIASTLGADCAFFIRNKPVYASGKGDQFEAVDLNLENYFVVIVKPDVHIKTESAYKNVVPKTPDFSLKEVIKMPLQDWKDRLVNDFEKTIFKKHPIIQHIKQELYSAGAVYASMSGSGSAVYGIFAEKIESSRMMFSECSIWNGKLV